MFCARAGSFVLAAMLAASPASAQDVPGIELCTAEKTMERRTSCLQSNVNFLQQSLSKQSAAARQRLDAATREIDALKSQLAALRKEIEEIRATMAAAAKDRKEPAKK
jgi:septal ring factor EnvC (AmiA/AmiB activator)